MTLDLNIPDHLNFVRYMYQCFESDLHKYQKCMTIIKAIQMLWPTTKQLHKGRI